MAVYEHFCENSGISLVQQKNETKELRHLCGF